MEQSPELLVYKASAGSGKTFTLAVEYMKLLIENPRDYQQVLAVTFTNKATAEMKERILSQLFGIWQGDQASQPYLEELHRRTGCSVQEVTEKAERALKYILHDYSHFRVETIDSFFQSVMRNLARELELSPNLNIELDNTEVLSTAVDTMIEKLHPSSPVLAWLLDYIGEKIANDKKWNVSAEVKAFGRNIFNEEYVDRGVTLRGRMKEYPDLIKNFRQELRQMQDEALKEMKAYADRFEELLDAHNLCVDDLKYGKGGVAGYFAKLKQGKLTEDSYGARARDCAASEKAWATKTSPYSQQIFQLASTSLMPLLQEAEQKRPANELIVNSCLLSLQNLNKLRLLTNIDDEVRLQNKENNRFLLSDTNALLHQLVREGDSSFVFEKLGSNIRHVMIDEFQDTSRMQWGNFRLLLLEGLSQGASSLIVGDVKQSIYRWRSGDWTILNQLRKAIGAFPIVEKTLKTNRRSETNIIHFNNELFQSSVEYLDRLHFTELGEGCEELKKAYSDVVQESPKESDKGYVQVTFLDKEDYNDKMLQELGHSVQDLLQQGVRLNDMAILVRKNKVIPAIAEYFDKQLGYRVVSDEAFRLDASSAVCMMIDALRILVDWENGVSKAQLLYAYHREVLKEEVHLNELLLCTASDSFPPEFTDHWEELRLMPLYNLLETLYRVFHLTEIPDQDAYLFAFFDAVTDYLQTHSSDLAHFITYWEDVLSAKTISSGEIDGIRIMSIHKSKGLEFHTVLIPFCDWSLEKERGIDHLVWCAPQVAPYNQLDIVPVLYSSAMARSIYRQDYLNERLQLWVDNLNLLYVAFTRAGKNLFIWTQRDLLGTVSELLTQSLDDLSQKLGVDHVDEKPFMFGTLQPSATSSKQGTQGNKFMPPSDKLVVEMKSMEPKFDFRQSNKSAEFIRQEDPMTSREHFIDRGQVLHTLFSRLGSKAEIPAAIERLCFEGVIATVQEKEEMATTVQRVFDMPMVQDWFSDRWTLFNECAILYRKEGELQVRRPDRVMINENETVVVDFKFGKPQKKYVKQVKEYMQLLHRMGYKGITGYLLYAESGEIERVD